MDPNYIERHSRQLILPGWSLELQKRISNISVEVPENRFLLLYLRALGINKIYHSRIEFSNSLESLSESAAHDYIIAISKEDSVTETASTSTFGIGRLEAIELSEDILITLSRKLPKDIPRRWHFPKLKHIAIDQQIGIYLTHKFSETIREI